jgi:hypothetical protein
MTAKTKTRRSFPQWLLVIWLWVYVPVLIVNQFAELPGDDNSISLGGGLLCLALVYLARKK